MEEQTHQAGATMRPAEPGAAPAARYHALDCVRAAAMFLGIFYHLQFFNPADFASWSLPGFGTPPPFNPKATIDAWLHSFRMPLFFLISGFFANLVLRKYGLGKYLTRRWWRIGAPLLVAFVAFGLLRTYFPQITTAAFGGMNLPAPPAAAGTNMTFMTFQPFGAGFTHAPAGGGGVMPGASGLPLGQAPTNAPPGLGFTLPGAAAQQFPNLPPFTLPVPPSTAALDAILKRANSFQDRVFEQAPWLGALLKTVGGQKRQLAAGNFQFEHLWFLWYLLLFVTLAPLITLPLSRLLQKFLPPSDRFGRWLLRCNLAPVLLGLAALPPALLAAGFDWAVEPPAAFAATFPDCFAQYFSDLPLYFLYFLAGWWCFRLRDGLPDVGRHWLWNLTLGVAGFAISQALFRHHGLQFNDPHYAQYRLAALALYALGAAGSGFGLLGFFQRYLNRPTKLGKYFTDTILWIYLVQLAVIPHVLPWIQPDRTTWWAASLAGMVAVTAVALVLFELLIRPTPLVHIFGPANLSRPNTPPPPPPKPATGADARP